MVCSATQGTYGAVRSMMTLADGLTRLGHSVQFVTFLGRKFGAEVRALGYPVHEVKVRAKADPLAMREIARIARTEQIDVVHCHLSTSSVNGAWGARIAHIASVATVHGLSGKFSYVWADRIIAVAKSGKDHLLAQGVRAEHVSVVLNGIDRAEGVWPTREEARKALGFGSDDVVSLATGRVTAMKGSLDAVRAVGLIAAQFPALRHCFLGDGDALEECKALSESLGVGDRIVFAGYQKEIKPYLAAADFYVHPSHKEALPMSIIEAMLEGLPVVGTEVGGIPEIVNSETGLLVPVGQPEALSREMARLAGDPELRRRLGEAGRKRAVDVFSAAAMARNTVAVYQEIVRA